MKLLLYCVKAKPYLVKRNIFAGVEPSYFTLKENAEDNLNGKIVAECDFEVEEIRVSKLLFDEDYITKTFREKEILKYSCLTYEELDNYLKGKNGYAIHIKNLNIFDKPKELNDYTYFRTKLFGTLGNAPQNMMYAYEVVPCKEEHLFRGVLQEFRWNRCNKCILISIQPQWLCKILNGEKTIEVRKKVLKEMIK